MWTIRLFRLSWLFLFGISGVLLGQGGFQINGNASSQGGTCYELTPARTSQAGSIWNLTQIDLNQPFDVYIDINLGCNNGGADGMAFVLQRVNTSVGTSGGGLGYQGITPSVAIELDTWQNNNVNDPAFDHVALMSNGITNHTSTNNLAGPVSILPNNANAEDCLFHDMRVQWNPITDSLKVFIDCNLVIAYEGDIVTNIFSGNNMVFWGLTAGTGAASNRHRVCLDYISFFNQINDQHICKGDTVRVDVGTGNTFSWSPVTGIDDPTIPNPKLFPDTTTKYVVTVSDVCGDIRIDSITIQVDDPAALAVDLGFDTVLCLGQSLTLRTDSTATISWNNASRFDTLLASAAGWYWAEKTNVCGSNRDSIRIDYERNPAVNLGPDQSLCDRDSLILDATFLSLTQFGTSYRWQDGSNNARFSAKQNGQYHVNVSNYCGTARDTIEVEFRYSPDPFSFGADTILCKGQTLSLNIATGNADYRWSDNSTDSVLTISTDGTYWGERFNVCGTTRDEIAVLFDDSISFDLGPDLLLCQGDQARLDMGAFPRTAYRWNNGTRNQDIFVTLSSDYIGTATNACNSYSDTVEVIVDLPPVPASLVSSLRFCLGDSRALNATVAETPTAPVSYLWTPTGDTTATFLVREAGTFQVETSNRCGSRDYLIEATTIAPPEVRNFPDSSLCSGEVVRLDVRWPGATYRWEDGSTSPERNITQGGDYRITLENECGIAADSFLLEELDCSCTVYLPTAFSPNGDGVNERFSISQNCQLSQVRLEVYNRWGRLVFSGDGPDASWDGRSLDGQTAPEGVYVWVLNYRGRFRSNELDKHQKGTVTLLR